MAKSIRQKSLYEKQDDDIKKIDAKLLDMRIKVGKPLCKADVRALINIILYPRDVPVSMREQAAAIKMHENYLKKVRAANGNGNK